MGSGETTTGMLGVHREVFSGLPDPTDARLMDSPFAFQENADELVEKINQYFTESLGHPLRRVTLPASADALTVERALADIRRGFHTLKGSGRMVGATEAGEFAWSFEDLLNRLVEGKISFSEPLGEAVRFAVAALGGLRARMLGEDSALDAAAINALKAFAKQLSGGAQPVIDGLQAALPEVFLQSAAAAGRTEQAALQAPDRSPDLAELLESGAMDPILRQLMLGEIRGYLSELERFVRDLAREAGQPVEPSLVRAVHTLAGTLSMAPLGQEAEVARAEPPSTTRAAIRGRASQCVCGQVAVLAVDLVQTGQHRAGVGPAVGRRSHSGIFSVSPS